MASTFPALWQSLAQSNAPLMLVRASERTRDAAVRRALGANSRQLLRPILTESLLIALSGGALGLIEGREEFFQHMRDSLVF